MTATARGLVVLFGALAVATSACTGMDDPEVYLARITGTVTSTSGASVAGLTVVAEVFSVGCDAAGGTEGIARGTTTTSGQFDLSPTTFYRTSKCVVVRVEKSGVLLASAAGRAEFRSTNPVDTQVIDVTIP